MSWSRIKAGLSTDEVRQLVQWYEESYSDGWRPNIYIESTVDDLYAKIGKLREQQNLPGRY